MVFVTCVNVGDTTETLRQRFHRHCHAVKVTFPNGRMRVKINQFFSIVMFHRKIICLQRIPSENKHRPLFLVLEWTQIFVIGALFLSSVIRLVKHIYFSKNQISVKNEIRSYQMLVNDDENEDDPL